METVNQKSNNLQMLNVLTNSLTSRDSQVQERLSHVCNVLSSDNMTSEWKINLALSEIKEIIEYVRS